MVLPVREVSEMPNDQILIINHLSKSFIKSQHHISEDSSLQVLDKLSLSIERGSFTALIGGNGAGKTTLFNIISRLWSADSGEVLYSKGTAPVSLMSFKPYEIARLGIGRMFQSNQIFEHLSILDNLILGYPSSSAELPFASLIIPSRVRKVHTEATEKARYLIQHLFGDNEIFWKRRNDLAGQLSYGQKRLLELVRLLMSDYSLLLLDEPTSGVHPILCVDIGRILDRLVHKLGITIFMIEHNMKFVAEHANFCHFMYRGKNHGFGTPSDILGDPDIRKIYMGDSC